MKKLWERRSHAFSPHYTLSVTSVPEWKALIQRGLTTFCIRAISQKCDNLRATSDV